MLDERLLLLDARLAVLLDEELRLVVDVALLRPVDALLRPVVALLRLVVVAVVPRPAVEACDA